MNIVECYKSYANILSSMLAPLSHSFCESGKGVRQGSILIKMFRSCAWVCINVRLYLLDKTRRTEICMLGLFYGDHPIFTALGSAGK